MKEYKIVKKEYGENVWNGIEKADVDTFKWMNNGYAPKVCAMLFHDNKNIYIKFEVCENSVTVKHFNMQEAVYRDSCVEFFFKTPEKDGYFNIETNAAGAMLLGFGDGRDGRTYCSDLDFSVFDIKASISDPEKFSGPCWSLEYKIPFSFIKEHLPGFDIKNGICANIYKCGDETEFEHYGMWNEVINDTPDFHRPEFFGRMYFEL